MKSSGATIVFWSWQNDTAPSTCRHFIKRALAKAVEQAGEELGLSEAARPELDHDTKNEKGMVDIAGVILRKIEEAAVFVADVTPIGKAENGKALPNPNVMIELGWAMNRPGLSRIIAVMNTATGCKIEDLPFDIRHRRVMTYNLAENATADQKRRAESKLVGELVAAIRANLSEHLEAVALLQEIRKIPTRSDNVSIWTMSDNTITHWNSFGPKQHIRVFIPEGPRAYIRIIPAGWSVDLPSATSISNLPHEMMVRPWAGSWASGDFGVCEQGFVNYWMTSQDDSEGRRVSENIAMYFDDTGEYWVLHGTVIGQFGEGLGVRSDCLLGGWSSALRQANAVFDRLGAYKVRRVELGLAGMRGVRWPGQWTSEQPFSRKTDFNFSHQTQDWSEPAQFGFLVRAYNKIRDLFGLPANSGEEVAEIRRRSDPGMIGRT